jgi:hypothetical protein
MVASAPATSALGSAVRILLAEGVDPNTVLEM